MAQSLQFSNFVYYEKPARRLSSAMPVSRGLKDPRKLPAFVSVRFPGKGVSYRPGNVFDVSCSYNNNNYPGSVAESETHFAPVDEALLLKKKSEEVEPYLSGRCIYLVGMMGSGKTTVGKILSQVLQYSFHDCDTLIEQETDGTSVADIFKLHGEIFFRHKETEVLKKVCELRRLVVSTGGGAVIRPINWKYMQKGISVWLDVPLEALANRITNVGTGSRPLLPKGCEDPYTETLKRLSSLLEERGEAYENASVKVSFGNIAAKLGQDDVEDLTPTAIAIEALEQIAFFLRKEDHEHTETTAA